MSGHDAPTEDRAARLSPRARRRFAVAVVALTGLWATGRFVVVPRVIRSAYEGTGLGWIGRMMSGRGSRGVDAYLAVADRLVILGGILLAIAIAAAFAAWILRRELRQGWNQAVREGGSRSVVDVAFPALTAALVAGLVEASARWWRYWGTGYISPYNDVKVFWMAPLSLGLGVFLLVLLAFYALRGPRYGVKPALGVSFAVATGTASLILGLSLGRPPFSVGIHRLAVLFLAIGVGVTAGRLVVARPRLLGELRKAALPAALGLAVVPLLATALDRLAEHRRMGALPEPAGGPDVILIVWDTVRRDNLSLYGYPRSNTPRLEALAPEAAVFDAAVAPSSWTLPTHGSLFTGRHPYELSADWEEPLDGTFPTLAERFRANGYATGGFSANYDYVAIGSGLERGFIRFRAQPGRPGAFVTSTALGRMLIDRWTTGLRLDRRWAWRKYAPMVNDEFLSWVDGVGDRPIFAFLNYWDAHAPYQIHEGLVSGEPPEPPGIDFASDEETRRDIDGYDSAIGLMDRSVAELLGEIERRGRLDRTIVVVVSDHGEHLWDHGLTSHANSLYAQLIRVPLVMVGPGVPGGRRIDDPVSLRDLPSTLASLAGLDTVGIPGRSLERLFGPAAAPGGSPALILSELSEVLELRRPPGEPIGDGGMKSVVRGNLHYILNGDGEEEVYDWTTDPQETRNIASTAPAAALDEIRAYVREVLRQDTLPGAEYHVRAGRTVSPP